MNYNHNSAWKNSELFHFQIYGIIIFDAKIIISSSIKNTIINFIQYLTFIFRDSQFVILHPRVDSPYRQIELFLSHLHNVF
jgi:hypothetical protein